MKASLRTTQPLSPHSTRYASLQRLEPSHELSTLFPCDQPQPLALHYLKQSPHYGTHSDFTDVVAILEAFNERVSSPGPPISPHRLYATRFLYREMLGVATMGKKQLQAHNHPLRIAQWYQSIGEKSSFLEGVRVERRSECDPAQDTMVRKTYASNVFSNLKDYQRRELAEPESRVEVRMDPPEPSQAVLPRIEVQLYRSASTNMRQWREQQEERRHLLQISKHRTALLEHCQKGWRPKQGVKTGSVGQQKENRGRGKYALERSFKGTQTFTDGFKSRKALRLSETEGERRLENITGMTLLSK